jgi:hypothetical protein
MGQRYNFNFDAKEEEKVAITDPLHCLEWLYIQVRISNEERKD